MKKYKRKYQLFVKQRRELIDLRDYKQIIEEAVYCVMGDKALVSIQKEYYELCVKPTSSEARRIGQCISKRCPELKNCGKEREPNTKTKQRRSRQIFVGRDVYINE